MEGGPGLLGGREGRALGLNLKKEGPLQAAWWGGWGLPRLR